MPPQDRNNPSPEIRNILAELRNLRSMSALEPEKYAEQNGYAEKFVRECNDLNSTQLRKIFHHVKGLKREFAKGGFERRKVSSIMPLLAYSRGRRLIPEDFYNLMNTCFGQERCKTKEDFDAAVSFLEAIVAYHVYLIRR